MSKKNQDLYMIQITNSSGSVIEEYHFHSEWGAQTQFDQWATIKHPKKLFGMVMNCGEYQHSGNIGSMRLVVNHHEHGFLIRRELYRNA